MLKDQIPGIHLLVYGGCPCISAGTREVLAACWGLTEGVSGAHGQPGWQGLPKPAGCLCGLRAESLQRPTVPVESWRDSPCGIEAWLSGACDLTVTGVGTPATPQTSKPPRGPKPGGRTDPALLAVEALGPAFVGPPLWELAWAPGAGLP